MLDGHEGHRSVGVEAYCKDHNIISLYTRPHSSHLTQPPNVGFFRVLKGAYWQEINTFIRAHINHTTKVESFLAFHIAYKRSVTKENIVGSFRGAGLVYFNPQAVSSKRDIKV